MTPGKNLNEMENAVSGYLDQLRVHRRALLRRVLHRQRTCALAPQQIPILATVAARLHQIDYVVIAAQRLQL